MAALADPRRTAWRRAAVCAALAIAPLISAAVADGGRPDPTLRTNQTIIEEQLRRTDLDLADRLAVFRFVFASLPGEVRVYPTENYFYFRFVHNGVDYAGNLRLAASDRDRGIVHFAYFADATAWTREGDMNYEPLSSAQGVTVSKLDALKYTVTFEGRTVTFLLNDLASARPPEGLIQGNEVYIGPVFDESAIRFFLVFNPDLKLFHYVLDETVPVPDDLAPMAEAGRILIGRRTGFAFYDDPRGNRKLLIGVHAANALVNNYYDGPFDQLPDNFNTDDTLRMAVEASDPSVAGRLDRFLYFDTGEGRYLIGPYLQYSDPSELLPFDRCATDPSIPADRYYACFALQGGGQ
jgi:hypothetical protein